MLVRVDAYVVEKSTGEVYRIITIGGDGIELETSTGKYMCVTPKQLRKLFRSV